MRICVGWAKTPLFLSLEKRYYPEQIQSRLDYVGNKPLWIQYDGEYVRLKGVEQIALACQLASIYHNGPDCKAPFDDGWAQETNESWENAIQHMMEDLTDEENDDTLENLM